MKKLVIVIHRAGKKHARVEADLPQDASFDLARKIFEAEVTLNSLPTTLRWHMTIEEGM